MILTSRGGFQAYWRQLFALCKSKRPKDFGEKPNKAEFDVDADYKIRNSADPPFKPFEISRKGYDDCMLLMAYYTCVNWCLRGATEVSLIVVCVVRYLSLANSYLLQPSNITRDHFEVYTKEVGEYVGRRCLQLHNH